MRWATQEMASEVVRRSVEKRELNREWTAARAIVSAQFVSATMELPSTTIGKHKPINVGQIALKRQASN